MAIQLQANGETIYAISSFSINSMGPHTLMCWLNVNVGTWTSAGQRSMVGLYSLSNIRSGTGCAVQIGTFGTGNINVWDWGGLPSWSTTGYTPPVNTWIHVAFTYDGTYGYIYINGVLNNTNANVKNSGSYNMIFINGYIYGITDQSSGFQTDGVLAFNRQLSSNEIL